MFCGTDNILQSIPHIRSKCENIPWYTVNLTEHCYGSEYRYFSHDLVIPSKYQNLTIGQKFFDNVIDKVYWYYASNSNNMLLHIDSYRRWTHIIIILL